MFSSRSALAPLALLAALAAGCGANADEASSTTSDSDLSSWRHVHLGAADRTKIDVDFVMGQTSDSSSLRTFARPVWINVSFSGHCPASVRAVFLTVNDSPDVAASSAQTFEEVDLTNAHDAQGCRMTGQLRKDVEVAGSYTGYGYNYHQELAIVADGSWLTDPVSHGHNFKFNFLKVQ
jgi:hypothetical protein